MDSQNSWAKSIEFFCSESDYEDEMEIRKKLSKLEIQARILRRRSYYFSSSEDESDNDEPKVKSKLQDIKVEEAKPLPPIKKVKALSKEELKKINQTLKN